VAFVIIQWLLLLPQTSPHYLNIPDMISNPSRWQEMNNLMRQANEHVINVADQVTREEDMLADFLSNNHNAERIIQHKPAAQAIVKQPMLANKEVGNALCRDSHSVRLLQPRNPRPEPTSNVSSKCTSAHQDEAE
jgi:hypothetical protein